MTYDNFHGAPDLLRPGTSHPGNAHAVLVKDGGAANVPVASPTVIAMRSGNRRPPIVTPTARAQGTGAQGTSALGTVTQKSGLRAAAQRGTEAGAVPAKSASAAPHPLPRLLIGVERRAFFQGCLSLWFDGFCPDFRGLVVDDVRTPAAATALGQAAAMIIGVGPLPGDEGWLDEQVAWLRGRHPRMPVLAIVDDADQAATDKLVGRFAIQGYIPASTNLEVAAAAARLIVAGGSYFPRMAERAPIRPPAPVATSIMIASRNEDGEDRLTPRETAVLELLSRGTPNKLIAYRLGISLSTAKVHVHNIIRKLHARNRTEVALVAQKSRHDHQGVQSTPRPTPGEAIAR
jgi:DNA-binding NarL/FixJ family response regulator